LSKCIQKQNDIYLDKLTSTTQTIQIYFTYKLKTNPSSQFMAPAQWSAFSMRDLVFMFYKYSQYFILHNPVHTSLFIVTFIDTVCLKMHFSVWVPWDLSVFHHAYFHASFHHRLINLHSNFSVSYGVVTLIKSIVYLIVMWSSALIDWNTVVF
jgi:hypothetical protein